MLKDSHLTPGGFGINWQQTIRQNRTAHKKPLPNSEPNRKHSISKRERQSVKMQFMGALPIASCQKKHSSVKVAY